MLKVDRLTSIQSRGKFARICVEIDLERQLTSKIQVLGHVLSVEYEGLHLVCFGCGKYGHKKDYCSEFQAEIPVDASNEMGKEGVQASDVNMEEAPKNGPETTVICYDKNGGGASGVSSANHFGPWMLMKRPLRKKGTQTKSDRGKREARSRGSRFQILEDPQGTSKQVSMLGEKEGGHDVAALKPVNQEWKPGDKEGGLMLERGENILMVP